MGWIALGILGTGVAVFLASIVSHGADARNGRGRDLKFGIEVGWFGSCSFICQ